MWKAKERSSRTNTVHYPESAAIFMSLDIFSYWFCGEMFSKTRLKLVCCRYFLTRGKSCRATIFTSISVRNRRLDICLRFFKSGFSRFSFDSSSLKREEDKPAKSENETILSAMSDYSKDTDKKLKLAAHLQDGETVLF